VLQRQREIRQRRIRMGILIAIPVVILAVAGVVAFRANQAAALPGRNVATQGNAHIGKGQEHASYNSRPATSGPHWNIPEEAPVAWGIYKEPIPDEAMIHNLEHGGIAIQYNCRDCPDLVERLEDFYRRYTTNPANRLPLYPQSTKIVVAPYDDMSTRIALTAWHRIDTFDAYDEERITRFVDAWRDKGPERIP
jgi:hypothetical protein